MLGNNMIFDAATEIRALPSTALSDEQDFIRKVIELYHQARLPAFGQKSTRIQRGISRPIPELIEDLFAAYLDKKLIDGYQIFVNHKLSIPIDNKKPVNMQPDISLVKNGKALVFFDLKNDLGYKRNDFIDWLKNKNKLIECIRGMNAKTTNGITKEDISFEICNDIKYHVISLSDQNITKEKFKSIEEEATKLPHINLSVLSREVHPNFYPPKLKTGPAKTLSVDEVFEKISIQVTKFDEIVEFCNKK